MPESEAVQLHPDTVRSLCREDAPPYNKDFAYKNAFASCDVQIEKNLRSDIMGNRSRLNQDAMVVSTNNDTAANVSDDIFPKIFLQERDGDVDRWWYEESLRKRRNIMAETQFRLSDAIAAEPVSSSDSFDRDLSAFLTTCSLFEKVTVEESAKAQGRIDRLENKLHSLARLRKQSSRLSNTDCDTSERMGLLLARPHLENDMTLEMRDLRLVENTVKSVFPKLYTHLESSQEKRLVTRKASGHAPSSVSSHISAQDLAANMKERMLAEYVKERKLQKLRSSTLPSDAEVTALWRELNERRDAKRKELLGHYFDKADLDREDIEFLQRQMKAMDLFEKGGFKNPNAYARERARLLVRASEENTPDACDVKQQSNIQCFVALNNFFKKRRRLMSRFSRDVSERDIDREKIDDLEAKFAQLVRGGNRKAAVNFAMHSLSDRVVSRAFEISRNLRRKLQKRNGSSGEAVAKSKQFQESCKIYEN